MRSIMVLFFPALDGLKGKRGGLNHSSIARSCVLRMYRPSASAMSGGPPKLAGYRADWEFRARCCPTVTSRFG